MATQVQSVNKIQAGLCPHGLPPSACPICSQSMGGGGMKSERRKPGEMTYHECAMIGNLMRARKLAQKEHENTLKNNLLVAKNFENNISKLSAIMQEFISKLSNNFLTKPIAFVLNNTALPLINSFQNILKTIPQIIQNFNNLKFEITDKLNAIYGEIKNFINKQLSDLSKIIKENFPTLFKIFKKQNTKDEDNKIDDDKKIFNLKTIINKILKKKDKKDDQSNQNNK